MSAPFVATKFDREPEQRFCDEDCAEFLSVARFEIPFPAVAKNSDDENLRVMHDALQKAWIVLDELLDLINSEQLADAREAVRLAGSLQISKGL